jgi:hypothetical protein
MHGVNTAVRSAGRFADRLHKARFRQTLPQCPPARRKLPSTRDWILVTAFRSPGSAAPLSASLPGSTFPACTFKSAAAVSATRSVFQLRYQRRFAPPPAASTPGTRCRVHMQPLPESLRSFTLLRDCYVPRGQSSNLVQPVSPPIDSPDSPSLPAA